MTGPRAVDPDAARRLAAFLRPDCEALLFREPTGHPALGTGLCYCDQGFLATAKVYARAALLWVALAWPGQRLKAGLLRALGVRVGRNVHISPGVWIDPVYPHLVAIGDGAFVGMWVRILTHGFRREEFQAGRVAIGQGAILGAGCMIGCGTRIGAGATVAPGAVFEGELPDGATAIGNPPRIVRRAPGSCEEHGDAR